MSFSVFWGFLQNHPISVFCLAVVSACTLLLLPTIPLPNSSTPACSFSRTSQRYSLHRALCTVFARELLESHQAAAKLRGLFVQMLLATPTCCEVVMTACSIASFLPVKTFWSFDSLCCSSSLVHMTMFASFRLKDSGSSWTKWSKAGY